MKKCLHFINKLCKQKCAQQDDQIYKENSQAKSLELLYNSLGIKVEIKAPFISWKIIYGKMFFGFLGICFTENEFLGENVFHERKKKKVF